MIKKEEKKSLVDELIQLKFPDEEKNSKIVNKFMQSLIDEVLELVDSIDDENLNDEENNSKYEDGTIHNLNRDDFPEDIVPFMVLKKETVFIEYICPHCSHEDKLSVRKFDKTQTKNFICPNCSKEFLIKLDFIPKIRTYVEK